MLILMNKKSCFFFLITAMRTRIWFVIMVMRRILFCQYGNENKEFFVVMVMTTIFFFKYFLDFFGITVTSEDFFCHCYGNENEILLSLR